MVMKSWDEPSRPGNGCLDPTERMDGQDVIVPYVFATRTSRAQVDGRERTPHALPKAGKIKYQSHYRPLFSFLFVLRTPYSRIYLSALPGGWPSP